MCGIYIILKGSLDNRIDEFVMGIRKSIEVIMKDKMVAICDYGRRISFKENGHQNNKYNKERYKKAKILLANNIFNYFFNSKKRRVGNPEYKHMNKRAFTKKIW